MKTATVRVCERWEMEIKEDVGLVDFGHWVFRSPKDSNQRLAASFMVYDDLRASGIEINSAHEYFGGVGAQSLIIQEMFQPLEHTVADFSETAVDHLKTVLKGTEAAAYHADAFDPSSYVAADLVALDEIFTVYKSRPGQPFRELMDRVFLGEPKAVELTENAGTFLHLQRPRYETMLGEGSCENYTTYLEALAEYFVREFGYGVATGYHYQNRGAKMILVPVDQMVVGLPAFQPLPEDHIRGVEVLSVHDDLDDLI